MNRLPLPGGTAPDLVLLLVAAVAVSTSPMIGLLTGFAGGLALDVAPPATHYAGEYALVFCLAGYFAARVAAAVEAATGERNPWVELGAMAAAARRARRARPALGLLLSDPNVTGPAIKHVLPGAIAWDLLLTPFVFFLVAWVAGLARPVTERAPRPEFVGAQRLAAVFRLASAGAAPGLRLAGTGAKFADNRPARRVPRAAPSRRQIKILGPNGPGRLWHRPARPGRRADDQAELRPLRQRAPTGRRSHPAAAEASGRAAASAVSAGPRSSTSAAGRPRSRRPEPAGPGQGLDPRRRPAGPGRLESGGAGTGAGSPVSVAGRRAAQGRAGCGPTPTGPAAAKRATPGQGLAPHVQAAARELVLKRPVDRLGAPLPQQGPVADPAPVAVRRGAVRRP